MPEIEVVVSNDGQVTIEGAMLEARRRGYSVYEQEMEDGAIKRHVMLPA